MSLARLFILFAIFAGGAVRARMVGELSPRELSPYSCKLVMRMPPERLPDNRIRTEMGICTVTIFSGTLAASAAHCFAGKQFESGEIFCPDEAPRKVVGWQIPDSFPRKDEKRLECRDIAHDLAVVRFTPAFRQHARLPRNAEEVTALTNDPEANCRIHGYGQDRKGKVGDHNGRRAVLGRWLVATQVRTWTNSAGAVVKREETPQYDAINECGALQIKGTFTPDGETRPISVILSGDSGGGLICRDAGGTEVLVGITSGSTTNEKQPVASSVSLGRGLGELKGLIQKLLDRPAYDPAKPFPRHEPALTRRDTH